MKTINKNKINKNNKIKVKVNIDSFGRPIKQLKTLKCFLTSLKEDLVSLNEGFVYDNFTFPKVDVITGQIEASIEVWLKTIEQNLNDLKDNQK